MGITSNGSKLLLEAACLLLMRRLDSRGRSQEDRKGLCYQNSQQNAAVEKEDGAVCDG